MPENASRNSIPILRSHTASSILLLAFRILGVYSTNAASQFNAAFCTLRYYVSLLAGARLNITSFYQCTAVIIPVLTTLVQLKYQGITDQSSSPFATHPRTMLVAVASSIVGYLAYIALLRVPLRRRFGVAAHLLLAGSGYSAVVSLAALLLPDSLSIYVYSVFVFISAAEVLYCCKLVIEEEEGVYFQAYRRRVNRFFNNFRWVAGNPNRQRLYILPV